MPRPRRDAPPQIRFRAVNRYWCRACGAFVVLQPCPGCALRAALVAGPVAPAAESRDQGDGAELVIPPPTMPPPDPELPEFSPERLERLGRGMQRLFITHPRSRPPEHSGGIPTSPTCPAGALSPLDGSDFARAADRG